MLTSQDCLQKYGIPELEKNMILWKIPTYLQIKNFPKKIYCNKDLIQPLKTVLQLIIDRNLQSHIHSFDGCFNIRKKVSNNSYSLHSWGVAIDINAKENGYGVWPELNRDLAECFEQSGFEWGGRWVVPDGMHFQLKTI